MQTKKSYEAPRHSPWGEVQHVESIADGVYLVSTASHGGVWLAPPLRERLAKVCAGLWTPFTGTFEWLEEDCDLSVAVVWLGESWPNLRPGGLELAIESVTNYRPYFPAGLAKMLRDDAPVATE